MNKDSDRLEQIFSQALQIEPADARQAFLDQACGGDDKLRQRVEKMLIAQPKATPFLEQPFAVIAPTIDQPIAERLGTQIGPYKLHQEIGEGGMGVVYMALQKEPVRRKVALKIIKPGMDTREVIARFAAEEQALAMMDHPNIARVFDAGTTDTGRPYFVMELVNGVPITQYCDDNNSNTGQRLELFTLVCHAVQHAHQKGIIHRDIKPSNILVTLHDGVPVPKVIDFGIAKAINQELTSRTMATGVGHMIGTPLYMSPEQAERSGLDIDTRSDIYSLGVLLYELLTGSTPFASDQFKDVGLDEVRRLIREQEPPRPSTRISTMGLAATTVSEHRRTNPVELSNSLRHELDWIVMKALEKDRTRRYESATDFARDIQRYLNDEAVEACPPSTVYRLRKFMRRHQGAVIATTAVSLALILGAGVAAGQAYRATKAEKYAEEQLQIAQDQERLAKQQTQLAKKQKKLAEEAAQREGNLRVEAEQQRDLAQKATERAEAARQQSEAVTKFLVDIFHSPDPERDGRTVTVFETLGKARQRIDAEFKDNPPLQAELLGAIGGTYLSLGLAQESTELASRAYDMLHKRFGLLHPGTLRSMHHLGSSHLAAGRSDEGVSLLQEHLRLMKESLGATHPDTLEWMNVTGGKFFEAKLLSQALPLLEETLQLRREALGPDHADTLTTATWLGSTYTETGRLQEAVELLENTLRQAEAKLGATHGTTQFCLGSLAGAYSQAGRTADAVRLYERALEIARTTLGPDHVDVLIGMNNLAIGYFRAGRHQEAVLLFERTLELCKNHLGPDHSTTLTTRNNLAMTFKALAEWEKALAILEEIVERMKSKPGPNDPRTLDAMHNLGASYRAAGRLDQAIPLLEETLKLRKEVLGPDSSGVLSTMNSLAVAFGNAGRFEESIRLLEETLELEKAKLGPHHPQTLLTMGNVTGVMFAAGRREEALVRGAEAMELMKSVLGADHVQTLECMASLAGNYLRAGRRDEALALCEQLVELSTNTLGPAHPNTLASERLLSFICVELRQYAQTQRVLERMLESRPLDATTWCHLGLVRLASGDQEGYQRGCHELIRRYGEAAAPPFPGWELAWCCKMAPIGEEDAQQVERVAREAYAAAAAADNSRARSELACALYRAGKIDESLEHLQALWESDTSIRVWSGVWLAMAHARLGHGDDAKKHLDVAVEARKNMAWPDGSFSALEHDLLRREAESLLEAAQAKPDESPAGDGNK